MLKSLADGRAIRFVLAVLICAVALILPYRARTRFNRLLSFVIHLPYVLFGRLARFLLRRLDLMPSEKSDV